MSDSSTILVTGGSGFIARYCILQALQAGHTVRTTVRTESRKGEVISDLKTAGAADAELTRLTFYVADLMKDEGWPEAVKGSTYVLHVASPFPPGTPKHEDELVKPAREGTLRVLKAVTASGGVKRVVLTSSVVAIQYGHPNSRYDPSKPFTEADWTDASDPKKCMPYPKSKTVAERAAWEWQERNSSVQLTTICPVCVLPPVP